MKIKLYSAIFLFICSLAFVCSCTDHKSHEEIESDIESYLKIDIPSEFSVSQNKVNLAIGDYGVVYDISFNDNDFTKIMNQIDLTQWTKRDDYSAPPEGGYKRHFKSKTGETVLIYLNLDTNNIYYRLISD
jgi:hypothetical protein